MNHAAEWLNRWGEWGASFSYSMLLQSTVLIAILAGLDCLLKRRARAIVRYSLWMVLLVKLVLPVNFSLPTSGIQLTTHFEYSPPEYAEPGHLVPQFEPNSVGANIEELRFDKPQMAPAPGEGLRVSAVTAPQAEPETSLNLLGWLSLSYLLLVAILFGIVIHKCASLLRFVRSCPEVSVDLQDLLDLCRQELGIRRKVRLRVADRDITPALCGIIRPTIVLPHSLASTLQSPELRAILLHELAHLKRGDLFVNLLQTILQIIYFFHPLLWLANAHIRKLREQAVDEVVLVAMGAEAESYPVTLVNVARMKFSRPGASLGAIGILESKSTISVRIRRMLDRPFPKSTRLGYLGFIGLIVLCICVVPMGAKDQGKKEDQASDAEAAGAVPTAQTEVQSTSGSVHHPTQSLKELFAKYEIYAERRKRSQAAIHARIIAHNGAVEFLLRKLQINAARTSTGEETQARRKAAYLVGNFKGHAAQLVPALLNCLEDDEEVRHAATQALGQFGERASQAVPMLKEELHFENRSAGQALSQIAPRSEDVLDAILAAALDPSKQPDFRSETIYAIRAMQVRNAALTNALEKLSVEGDEQLKSAALFLLGKPAASRFMNVEGAGSKFTTNDLPALIERVRNNANDYQAINGLRQLGSAALPALPVLIEALEQRKGRFPANFPTLIAEMGPAASNAVPVIIACLADDDSALFNNSVNALGKIGLGAIAAKPKLIPLLDDFDPMIRWQAANALRKIDPSELDRCLPVLLPPLRDGTANFAEVNALADLPQYRQEVAEALRKMIGDVQSRLLAANTLLRLDPSSGPELLPILIEELQNQFSFNRKSAATLLGKIGAPARPALPVLREAVDSDDSPLAEIARESIRKIEQNSP